MHNMRLYSTIPNSLTPENRTKKLIMLLEWCKLVYACIESGQIDDAKIFLEQAIHEAEVPSQEQTTLTSASETNRKW